MAKSTAVIEPESQLFFEVAHMYETQIPSKSLQEGTCFV